VSRLDSFKAKAHALPQSGYYYGLFQFELSFEEGFEEARGWLALASTKEEWNVFARRQERNVTLLNKHTFSVTRSSTENVRYGTKQSVPDARYE
jgi:hypothetical protein